MDGLPLSNAGDGHIAAALKLMMTKSPFILVLFLKIIMIKMFKTVVHHLAQGTL